MRRVLGAFPRFLCVAGAMLAAAVLLPTSASADHELSTVKLSPKVDRNPLSTDHTITATVTSTALRRLIVRFEIVDGPNKGHNVRNCVVDPPFAPANLGSCSTVYRDTRAKNGDTDTIAAWIFHEGVNDPMATATKTWGSQLRPRQTALLGGAIGPAGRACKVDRFRRGGRVASVTQACLTRFRIENDDPVRDFGILWLQARVKARKGFCATRVRSDLGVPPGAQLGPVTPETASRGKRRRVGRAHLEFFPPESGGLFPVSIAQTFYVHGGHLFPRLIKRESESTWRVVWTKGQTRRPVALAHGFAYSWPSAEGPPEFPSASSVAHRLVSRGKCPQK